MFPHTAPRARHFTVVVLLVGTLLLLFPQPAARAIEPAADSCDAPVATIASRTVALGDGMLNDLAAAPDGIWAVGETAILDSRYRQPLIQRWDGRRWVTAATPTYTTPGTFLEGGAVLNAVGVAAADDVWAAGYIGQYAFFGDEALVLRWNGSAWSRLQNSGALSTFTEVSDLAVLGRNQVWAIGASKSGDTVVPAVARWDGSTWVASPTPGVAQGTRYRAIGATGPDELWIVGDRGIGVPSPVILRFTGGAWAALPSPVAEGALYDVATGPGGAVWAVGERFGSPFSLRWDGAQLQQVPTPESLRGVAGLNAVVVAGPDDVWAAGTSGSGGKLLHWDGTTWELFARQTQGDQANGYNALLLSGPGDLWAAGFAGSQRGRTLIDRYQARLSIGLPRVVQDGGSPALALTLGLNVPAATSVRATLRTEDAGAVGGRDYTPVNTTVTIPACGQTATVLVPLTPGASPPEGAAFRVVVEAVSGAGLVGSSRLVPLTGPQGLVSMPLLSSLEPAPSGRIAYVSSTGGDGTNANTDIFTANLDGSAPRRLTTAAGQDLQPAWSPDGRRIAFSSARDGNANIYLMNADGSGQTPLTADPGADFAPVFSPDGSQIAFVSNRSGQPLIYTMSAQGGAATLLSPPNSDVTAGALSWAPDGRRIVFESTNFRRPGLFILGLDRSLRQLTDQANDTTPAWSPDGRQIAFFGARGSLKGLYLIQPDGAGLREVNVNFDTDGAPSWSPDGRFIAYGFSSDGRVAVTGLDMKQPLLAPLPGDHTFTPAWSPLP